MLVSKNTYLKFALPQMRNPNASKWNIGRIGSQTQNFCVGQVHSILFPVNFIRVAFRSSVEYGLYTITLLPYVLHLVLKEEVAFHYLTVSTYRPLEPDPPGLTPVTLDDPLGPGLGDL